jgi:hypothetical protein
MAKAFTECFTGFAECFRHMANKLFSVVSPNCGWNLGTTSCINTYNVRQN